jgi:solute carrier family 5 (high affinity choline transporter), member 7
MLIRKSLVRCTGNLPWHQALGTWHLECRVAVAAIALIYAAFLLVGWWAARSRRENTAADFIVAGRSLPLWLATLTMTATWVDGGYLLGTAEGAYKSSIASGMQGGVCFGLSLILGGLLFARKMRELEFTTLVDPFEARFGPRWAVVLSIPAVMAEVFWSAELLVALGATFGVILDFDLTSSIVLSAIVVTLYTMIGGLWAVAYTDALQLALVALGLAIALPVALHGTGGLVHVLSTYVITRPDAAVFLPPLHATGSVWTSQAIVGWWDLTAMLIFGGMPWNCYFQRVLACRSPRDAQAHSLLAGLLTILLTFPPLLLGLVAATYPWQPELAQRLAAQPADALPMVFRYVTPPVIGFLGLAAIIGAVTSSFSASILSAGSMFSWNTCTRLLRPDLSMTAMRRVMRTTIAVLGLVAVILALRVQSVQALWFFTSDLLFVLLVPQLTCALLDRKANLVGSMVAFFVSLVLRLGGGEVLFDIPALIPYPEWMPFRTVAAAAGMVLLPLVSRLTQTLSPPRALKNVATHL